MLVVTPHCRLKQPYPWLVVASYHQFKQGHVILVVTEHCQGHATLGWRMKQPYAWLEVASYHQFRQGHVMLVVAAHYRLK
jgi:hypothetical protein